MYHYRPHSRGMTVIELAVTICVLGVLIFFTLKGTALIAAMRGIAVGYELQQFQNLVLSYQTQYHALPGDDPSGPRRWSRPIAVTTLGDIQAALTGNGSINGLFFDIGNPAGEQFTAWRDLRYSNSLDGDPKLEGLSALPENPFGGFYGFDEGNLGQVGGSLCATKIPGQVAESIDKRLDDGRINAGKLVATSRFSIADNHHFDAPDSEPYSIEKEYIICVPLLP